MLRVDAALISSRHTCATLGSTPAGGSSATRSPSSTASRRRAGRANGWRSCRTVPTLVGVVEPRIREQLQLDARMPATVIAKRIGWTRGITVVNERVAEPQPACLPPDLLRWRKVRTRRTAAGAPRRKLCTPPRCGSRNIGCGVSHGSDGCNTWLAAGSTRGWNEDSPSISSRSYWRCGSSWVACGGRRALWNLLYDRFGWGRVRKGSRDARC
jgi:hypothetical protein